MTMTRRQICEVVKHILDLTKRPNAFMETNQGRKQRVSHTPDSTVCLVCDRVHDEAGDDTSVRTVYCSTCTAVASIQYSIFRPCDSPMVDPLKAIILPSAPECLLNNA